MTADSTKDAVLVPAGPELVFGLVGAIGTDLKLVATQLEQNLNAVNYGSVTIALSELLHRFAEPTLLASASRSDRYRALMDAGDMLRRTHNRKDAVAVLGIRAIVASRPEQEEDDTQLIRPTRRTAYILRSLKTPGEVETLRRVYGNGFVLISAYQPLVARLEHLAQRIAASQKEKCGEKHFALAEVLIQRDERDRDSEYGQDVRGTFPLADAFLDLRHEAELDGSIERLLKLVFGYEFITPTKGEFAMHIANASSLRSAEMGRQVGAAITDDDGNILAVGANELPKAGGGLVWGDDHSEDSDPRDWNNGVDTSDEAKRENVDEILSQLSKAGWLCKEKEEMDASARLEAALPLLSSTRMMNAIEYVRAVHAEAAALIDAARRGVSVQNATMYVTTFPCHNCAKEIIASGIKRVVFIEPYPKSLAAKFHEDAIEVELCDGQRKEEEGKVRFDAFVGIAPRIFVTLFHMGRRKEKDGTAVVWKPEMATPRHKLAPAFFSYMELESVEIKGLQFS